MAAPQPGDKIYLPTTLHVSHGVDDFQGGLCTVAATRRQKAGDREVTYVEVEEDLGRWVLWETYLEPKQEEWKKAFGERRGKPDPDTRPEFNRWED
jgi:hypothetical protein